MVPGPLPLWSVQRLQSGSGVSVVARCPQVALHEEGGQQNLLQADARYKDFIISPSPIPFHAPRRALIDFDLLGVLIRAPGPLALPAVLVGDHFLLAGFVPGDPLAVSLALHIRAFVDSSIRTSSDPPPVPLSLYNLSFLDGSVPIAPDPPAAPLLAGSQMPGLFRGLLAPAPCPRPI